MQAILKNWVPDHYFNQDPARFSQIVIGVHEEDGSVRMNRDSQGLPFRLQVLFDNATQDFYNIEEVTPLIVKNVLLVTIGVPLHFLGTLIWNIVAIPFELIRALFHDLNGAKIKQHFLNCIRAPYYALGCEIAALSALIRVPNDLRTLYIAGAVFASIEKEWNHGFPRQSDVIRHGDEIKGDPKTFFAAYCLQPIGNLKAPTKFFLPESPGSLVA